VAKGVNFTSKLWSLVMEKSCQVTKVEGYVYIKFIRDYGVKKKKKMCKQYICVNKLNWYY